MLFGIHPPDLFFWQCFIVHFMSQSTSTGSHVSAAIEDAKEYELCQISRVADWVPTFGDGLQGVDLKLTNEWSRTTKEWKGLQSSCITDQLPLDLLPLVAVYCGNLSHMILLIMV
jgi:hypothetical protein